MPTNRLATEKSPYLLQHAQNPVDWYPWNEEAFAKARTQDRPIFLSIGYSTCHWCHVMERESFENEELAAVLNRFFIPIKVDREERPDIDRIYMTFVQAMTGGGGWPMSVWLTPDLKPFYGGTYFPPDSRWGRPGFRQVLEQLAKAWQTDRASIMESGADIVRQLEEVALAGRAGRADASILDSGFLQFRRMYDSRLGGFGGAPKFPRPAVFNFLLRYAEANRNEEARDMVLHTLREMAKGGMNDQLGGGFHRYSVDARWFVPHFEKMLYDQAQLGASYVEAFQLTGEALYAEVARSIFDYVLRDMTHSEGGFYSAEDADSVIDPAHPHEKGEGAFYIWPAGEIASLVDAQTAEWFGYRYGVEPNGNVAEDPHEEFTERNILYQKFSIAETARRFAADEAEVRRALSQASEKLLRARAGRVRPGLDDKVLTAWNGLMISAFSKGARALGEPRYLEAAQAAVRFVLKHLYVGDTLLRRWREGEAAIHGFLDDYAFFINALLDLYETDFDENHLQTAIDLTARMRTLFEDTAGGGFFSTAEGDSSVILRIKEDYDGAEPSGNSVAILVLIRLARMTGKEEYARAAVRALDAFGARMAAGPSTLPQMLVALQLQTAAPKQIVLAGEREVLQPLLNAVNRRFLPFHTLLWNGTLAATDELRSMTPVEGKPAAYVCENFACQLPVTDPAKLAELVQ